MLTPEGITYQTSKGISIVVFNQVEIGQISRVTFYKCFLHQLDILASNSGANIRIIFDTEPLMG